jgi:hypothetical protein
VAGEVTQHGQAHPYSWLITIVSLRSKESEESHRSEWKTELLSMFLAVTCQHASGACQSHSRPVLNLREASWKYIELSPSTLPFLTLPFYEKDLTLTSNLLRISGQYSLHSGIFDTPSARAYLFIYLLVSTQLIDKAIDIFIEDKHFCGYFWVSAEVVVEAWEMTGELDSLPPSPQFQLYLWGLTFMQLYLGNGSALLPTLGWSDPKTIRKIIWPMIQSIFDLEGVVVSLLCVFSLIQLIPLTGLHPSHPSPSLPDSI